MWASLFKIPQLRRFRCYLCITNYSLMASDHPSSSHAHFVLRAIEAHPKPLDVRLQSREPEKYPSPKSGLARHRSCQCSTLMVSSLLRPFSSLSIRYPYSYLEILRSQCKFWETTVHGKSGQDCRTGTRWAKGSADILETSTATQPVLPGMRSHFPRLLLAHRRGWTYSNSQK